MEKQVKLSLITVCFNAGSLIEETLLSAVNQSFQDFELVIIDGGSTDNTLQKIKPFEKYIGTLVSEKDKGIYDAMNKGIASAKGEWLYFLNAGDSFYNNTVLEEVFSNDLACQSDFIYAQVETKNEPTGINYLNGKPVNLPMFYSHYPICHQATFAKKKVFNLIGNFDLAYPLVADSEWFIRLFKNENLSSFYLDKIIAYYDIQGATYHKRMKGYREYIRVGFRHFPIHIAIINTLLYPIIWLKVWVIRTFQNQAWFKKYRELKFKNKLAQEKSGAN
ncbi:MAG: glycosyltransferase [Bacteroidia bacterium]|nr:glycosyltransferase [Bacteroidia bacterium]MCF8425858.1 glycosyltransferase [Bacteroidia bacterium]MCF8445637.1 glycosyltransferase [Bacteroidia bacterium]